MGEDIKDLINSIKSLKADLKEEIKVINENINKKFEPLLKNFKEIEQKVEDHQKKLQTIDREQRKRNIVIHGLEAVKGENYWELERQIVKFLREKLQVQIEATDLDSVRIINKQKEKSPILVSFVALRSKLMVWANKRKLQGTRIRIDDDFPPEVLAERKTLIPKLRAARSEGKYAILKYNKLIIEERKSEETDSSEEEDSKEERKEKQYSKRRIRSDDSNNAETPAKKSNAAEAPKQDKKGKVWVQTIIAPTGSNK